MTNARVLVVRSDGPDAGGLEQSLRDLGYDVCAVAASVAEAIEKGGGNGSRRSLDRSRPWSGRERAWKRPNGSEVNSAFPWSA